MGSLMGIIRRWLLVDLPELITAWMLPSYRRPLGFLVGLGVLPLGIILVVAYQINASLGQTQALHNLHVASQLAAETIDETLLETLRLESAIAAQPDFLDHLQHRDRTALGRDVQRGLAFMPRADYAMVLSPEGEVLAVAPDRPELVGTRQDGGETFQAAQQSGWQPYISGVYLREGPEIEKVVGVVFPVRQGEQLVGLLQVQHRVEEVKSWLQKIRIEPDGFLYVVDQHQQLVVHPMQVLPGRPRRVADWPAVAQPLGEQGATLVYRQATSHRRWLAGINPVGELGWRVVAVQPESAALLAFRRVFWTLAGLISLLMVIVVGLSLGWVRLHLFSLRLLRQNAKLIRQLQQRWLKSKGGEG